MEDSVESGSRLEVSVSFGRFENEALSWEKWSSFSPNKYLEEVGNLSTPGSVAQKKAYFEAHYKKIAAQKAQELEQEKLLTVPFIPGSNAPREEDCFKNFENPSEPDNKFDSSNGERLFEEIVTVKTSVPVSSEAKDDNIDRSNRVVHAICFNEEKVEVSGVLSSEEKIKDDSIVNIVEPELNVGEDSLPVLLDTPRMDTRDTTERNQELKNSVERKTSALRTENSKSSLRNITRKVTPTKKEKNPITTKKNYASPITKQSQATTPRHSKPTLMSTPISVSRDSKKKANGPQPPKSYDFSARESKKCAPKTSLLTNSFGGLSVTRKSLIMESMGDKDIVKRAFKTFQNRTNGPMTDDKPSTINHVSSTAFEPTVSSFHTPAKGNIGLRKNTEKTATPRSHPGIKSNHLPSGSHKSSSLGTKRISSPSTGLRSDGISEKRKEFLKKLEVKSIAREVANAEQNAKPKVGIANGIHQRPTTLSR